MISISLSESREELLLSKLQAKKSPFVVRLPLHRVSSEDAVDEPFGFDEGKKEMLQLMELADFSAHEGRERTGKEAKAAWWSERQALDQRLRDLLVNIENIWLSGFRSMFSRHPTNPSLLSRFAKSFQGILDKHLPSRQRKGRARTPKVNLNAAILELFIGLGDMEDEGDLIDSLNDLLYFVVDILQFHGELNAYAEIDFDALTLDTQDALRSYHEAARQESTNSPTVHTILILDKHLHCIPWESLPCLDGAPVSRLPSLACLRERLLHQQSQRKSPEALIVSASNGIYMLNPSADLKHTQQTFTPLLASPSCPASSWTSSITGRAPTSEEFETALTDREILLYFGHGSGNQYIRGRAIQRLDKCAVAFLMGCSSAVLTEAGDFESYGVPMNYLQGGAPAMVGTLWDVTDKDCDRFAVGALEGWGLLKKEAEKSKEAVKEAKVGWKGVKGLKARVEAAKEEEKASDEGVGGPKMALDEAVAKARDRCFLRYLNGAAAVVYGVPVVLG